MLVDKTFSLQVSCHSNGVPQLRHPSKPSGLSYKTSPERDHLSLSLEGTRMIPPAPQAAASSQPAPTQPSAYSAVPKPFKKRYLAEQSVIVSASHNNQAGAGHSASPSPNSATPTPSSTPTPPISPVAADTARACEALLELGRGVEEDPQQQRNGYTASGSKNGDNLRQAVWKGVVGTLLSQQVGGETVAYLTLMYPAGLLWIRIRIQELPRSGSVFGIPVRIRIHTCKYKIKWRQKMSDLRY